MLQATRHTQRGEGQRVCRDALRWQLVRLPERGRSILVVMPRPHGSAVYKCEPNKQKAQPVGADSKGLITMKVQLTIEAKVNVASVISALSGLILTIAYVIQYL